MKSNGPLYTLGKGKFYREDNELTLDVGPFAAALEFACDKKAIVVGKPDPEFFRAALRDVGVFEENAVMVRLAFIQNFTEN
jgi:phospholysine phosphohistidine inorganic pyrophosphate phosphatase